MSEEQQNPYQAPEADIETANSSGDLLTVPNTVSAGRGYSWIERSISQTVKPQLGMWMLVGLVYGVISIVLSLIPILNIIVPYLVS